MTLPPDFTKETLRLKGRQIKAIQIDLEGTLYFKEAQIQGASWALLELERMGFQLCFLTNTDSKTASTIADELARMGLEVDSIADLPPLLRELTS